MELDFKELDSRLNRVFYKEDLFKILKEKGYNYISEFIYDQYVVKKVKSGELARLTERSVSCIRFWALKFGFTMKSRGGNNYNQALSDPTYVQQIKNSKGFFSSKETAERFKCSKVQVNIIWRKMKDGVPCGHPGCCSHVTHPCEGCGRIECHN